MSSYWDKLSPREQRLATLTCAVLVIAFAVLLVSKALGRIAELDGAIDRLEQDLVNYQEQDARGTSVDKAFETVAAQHSSTWTEAEIHNRLRQEIYRLALEDPNAPSGTPEKLVEIPTLRQGTLKAGGAGYREYQLMIKIPSSDIYSVLMFLLRLQSSSQSLRIDALDIARGAQGPGVTATITVTRTIVDGAPGSAEAAAPAAQEPKAKASVEWNGQSLEGWQAQGCTLELVAAAALFYGTDSGGAGPAGLNPNCLKVQSNPQAGDAPAGTPGAAVFMIHEIEAGVPYEVSLDAVAGCPATLDIMANDAAKPQAGAGSPRLSEGGQPLLADGKPYHYRREFSAPGDAGQLVSVKVPYITLATPGTQVYLDNVVVRKKTE